MCTEEMARPAEHSIWEKDCGIMAAVVWKLFGGSEGKYESDISDR